MPNKDKATTPITVVGTAKLLDRIHKYYLKGFQAEIWIDAKEVEFNYKFIESMEQMLIGSGYVSEAEVKSRHLLRVEARDGQVIVPFPFK